ncbi:MAG: uracil-DNA glycosylase [Acidimicrobiia bacterium]
MLLFEAPGGKATVERGGSGFVSPDNNDATAQNMWYLLRDAGVDRRVEVVTWNVVPWYVGDDHKIRRVAAADLREARPHVEELLGLLPNLGVVVLLGKRAQKGWSGIGMEVASIGAPHPSPQNLNPRPHLRDEILRALESARRLSRFA